MSVVKNNMKLSLNKSKVVQKEDKWIEQDLIVPDNMPDALKIINIVSYPFVSDVEVSKGRVKIVGKINYSIIYRANDEKMSIRGLNSSCPYSIILDNDKITEGCDVLVESNLKNIIYSLPNERKIAVKNEIQYVLNITKTEMIDVIKDFPNSPNIEFNKCSHSFCDIKESKRGYISSNENVVISKDSPAMYEILKYRYKIKDTEFKESYNKLLLKGVLEIQLLYVGEGNNICKEKVDIAFSGMVETESLTDNSKVDVNYILRDLNVHINPDIEQKTLSVDYKIEYLVTISKVQEVEYVEDFYSKNSDLIYQPQTVEVASRNVDIIREITINDTISDIVPDGYKIIDYDLDTSGIMPQLLEDSIQINGIAKLNVLMQNKENGEVENRNLDIMIDESLSIEEDWKNSNVNIKIVDKKLNVIQNGKNIDIKIVVYIDVYVENIVTINSIDKIEEEPINLKDISSISIYIVKPGDSIWKIAKKYKTSMENIIRINKLENPDVIDVGDKILVIR